MANDGGWSEGGEGGGEGGPAEPVAVLEQAEAGPYNYAIVESSDSQALIAWLNENDYSQPPEAHALIDHYVANDMLFVAVKLLKDKEVGDVAPIILDFQEENPCVPLVLTQVAATPDMPVKAYLLGDTRAVPTNWLHVDVNQKKLDWFAGDSWWNENSFYEGCVLSKMSLWITPGYTANRARRRTQNVWRLFSSMCRHHDEF